MEKILSKLFLFFGFLLFFLGFIELGLQTEWISKKLGLNQNISFVTELKIFKKDPLCGYLLSPTHTTQGVNINSSGFRGAEFTKEKPAGVIRVVCMGSSFTFGYRVKDEETFPSFLQHFLKEKYPNQKIQVINAGVPGFSSVNNLFFFTNHIASLKPDLILYQENRYNSPLKFIDEDSFFMKSERKILRKLYKFFNRVDSWIQKRSSLYLISKVELFKISNNEDNIWETINYQLETMPDRAAEPEEKDEFLQHVDASIKTIKVHGFPVVILETPWKAFAIRRENQSKEINIKIAKNNGIDFIETEERIKNEKGVFTDPLHLTGNGNKIFAKFVASSLSKQFEKLLHNAVLPQGASTAKTKGRASVVPLSARQHTPPSPPALSKPILPVVKTVPPAYALKGAGKKVTPHIVKQTRKKTIPLPHVTKRTANKVAPRVIKQAGKKTAPRVIKQTSKKAVPKVVKQTAKKTAPRVIKQTIKKAVPTVVKHSGKKAAPRVIKQTIKKAAPVVIKQNQKKAVPHMLKQADKKAPHIAKQNQKKVVPHTLKQKRKKTIQTQHPNNAQVPMHTVVGGNAPSGSTSGQGSSLPTAKTH